MVVELLVFESPGLSFYTSTAGCTLVAGEINKEKFSGFLREFVKFAENILNISSQFL